MTTGTEEWDQRHGDSPWPRPDSWLVSLSPVLAAGLAGPALDLACGLGQNTLWVAGLGVTTLGVDASEKAVRRAREEARRREVPASFGVADLEAGSGVPEHPGGWGAILVFHFLHRPLLAELPTVLAPEGLLIYKTHLVHALRGPGARPLRPAFLLEPGELLTAFPGLVPLSYGEWAREGEAYSALLARRPGQSR